MNVRRIDVNRWLVQIVAKRTGYTYVTFDDEVSRDGAIADPVGVTADLPRRVNLDEVPHVPRLFPTPLGSADDQALRLRPCPHPALERQLHEVDHGDLVGAAHRDESRPAVLAEPDVGAALPDRQALRARTPRGLPSVVFRLLRQASTRPCTSSVMSRGARSAAPSPCRSPAPRR